MAPIKRKKAHLKTLQPRRETRGCRFVRIARVALY